MKKMNMRKRFWDMELQLFAGEDGGDGDSGEDDSSEDDPEEEDDSEDDSDEKKFTQKDVDDAVKKRLAREKRKWQREQKKKESGSGSYGRRKAGDEGEEKEEDNEKLKDAENRALKAETRAACFEAGVDKDAIDDVTALAHSYMAADEDLDLEDAIEKVVKKYPHFKKSTDHSEDEDDNKGKAWGERQRGRGRKKYGVEEAFLKKNPGLKID